MKKPSPNKLPSRDGSHFFANMLVGLHTTRAFWRRLSPGKYRKAVEYVAAIWFDASDNDVPRKKLQRPRWFPKRFVFPDKPRRL